MLGMDIPIDIGWGAQTEYGLAKGIYKNFCSNKVCIEFRCS